LCLEDKIVQQAVATVLEAIYEEDFLGFCVLQRQTERRNNEPIILVVQLRGRWG
jgi:hypothetical protein